MDKPILLLDVDGVLNPCPFDKNRSSDWAFEKTFRSTLASGGFNLNLSWEMGQALLGLGCEIVWLTTWILDWDHANENIGRAFGWAEKKVPEVTREQFWKILEVKRILAEPGPKVVWIDDDALNFLELFEDGADLDPHSRLLVVCPDSSVGLTKAHLQEIKEFLDG